MAHKTLIDGTAYEVKGGRCLVDGTVYGIQKGRTLVDGTGYDVKLASDPIAVTITSNQNAILTTSSATIGGTKYTQAASGIYVMPGDVIIFGYKVNDYALGSLTINGSKVSQETTRGSYTYNWTVPDGIAEITIVINTLGSIQTTGGTYSDVKVTTS